MNIRKWFFLFWSCMAVGAVTTAITGSIMQWTDQSFGFMGLEAAGFNALMMALVGTMIGAFSQMGFFAYLTLNYIALSVFRKKYLWNALQAYTTIFAVFLLGYVLYENRAALNNWMFWALPLVLAVFSWIVGVIKVKQTNRSAFIPTLFLMYVGTTLEAWPALGGENNASAVIFMFIPLFVCNAYQILLLHRILKPAATDSASEAKPVA
ncbi:KinB-signaling pathway activation protein [Paenibacillus abyssi]|uniref:KinB-signaling pathway activation protein n=1 Tax=Paenibacillus abyssi TaxID=1340531 RepID=A0A917FTK1_9BACL|nr:KinB-signaling pathway activation protein [Paenibacillus abyssi]GGG07358.1 KinB-signaling pathway activation protein [Paenibacillus abyssi]